MVFYLFDAVVSQPRLFISLEQSVNKVNTRRVPTQRNISLKNFDLVS